MNFHLDKSSFNLNFVLINFKKRIVMASLLGTIGLLYYRQRQSATA